MPQLITEAGKITAADTATGKVMITLITPGWGSSGYYSAEVLEQAAKDRVFPVRTQQHIDHMTEAERRERPAGSLLTLAAGLTEDAVWDPDYVDEETGNRGRLAAPSLVGSRYRDIITEFKDFIGTSIAVGADVTIGEAEGRKGTIIQKLYPDSLNRVDFVTVAGRGGKVDKILEAAVRRIEEVTANDIRAAISTAVRDAYQDDGVWVWVLDHDDANVWFEQESADASKTWQQAYTLNGNTAELTGDLVEVRRVTSYVPIQAPAAESKDSPPVPAGVTENEKEPIMATIQIEEAEHRNLIAQSSRATALESEVSTATERATVAEAALQESNDSAAAALVASALEAVGISAPKTAARLAKGYPVKENGALDTAAFTADLAESIAELQVANGAGTVRGLGDTVTESKTISDDDVVNAL
ncbi:head maturation protease [Arthrobacter phage TripleJ]|uniref:Capsid maturation protease n=1 Tax=Arthrobacter phage TripleJ TaxID=2599838 RepID=A0A5J6TIJ7_9CAUD|nr:head maturation protease [Arthrobacter phage TripleJ]QFG09549.1 capsid maturation protease [Arthrobacter phage TripleJ]